jgi:hypothetical protein
MSDLKGTYWRWTAQDGALCADILGADTAIVAYPEEGLVRAAVPNRGMTADEARMIGVRLIEGAALADAGRSVRGWPQ